MRPPAAPRRGAAASRGARLLGRCGAAAVAAAVAGATAGLGFAASAGGAYGRQRGLRQQPARLVGAVVPPADAPAALVATEASESAGTWSPRLGLAACAGLTATVAAVVGRVCRRSSGPWPLAGGRRGLGAAARGGAEAAVAVPPIWVINLDKSVDRWSMCQDEFAKQGVQGERFPAVLGKALPKAELEEKATVWARWFCTPGMIGCFLSHMGCWKKVVDEGHEAAIVLEDDIVLFDGFEGKVKELLHELPDDWDVCLLGAVGCVDPVKEPIHMQVYGLIVGGWHPSPGKSRLVSKNVFVPYKPAGTHAYMVSQRGAAKMLKRNPKARYHVDVTAWSQQDLNLYAAKDFLATQRFGDDTTVSKTGKPLTEGFLRWIWTISGIGSMGSRAGVENLTWAWKVALFSIPLPFGRHVIVETGPASIPFLAVMIVGAATRNLKLIGGALTYFTILISIIRALAGNFNLVPLGSLALTSGALLLRG